jgi:DNA-binding response OmpR family regulator
MSHVWDDAGNSYSNILDVYASRLRRKLDDGEKVPLFTTVRGAGFMLDAPAPRATGRARGEKRKPARNRS